VYRGVALDHSALLQWANEKCVPVVRELTFENAEVFSFVLLFFIFRCLICESTTLNIGVLHFYIGVSLKPCSALFLEDRQPLQKSHCSNPKALFGVPRVAPKSRLLYSYCNDFARALLVFVSLFMMLSQSHGNAYTVVRATLQVDGKGQFWGVK